jgi:NitT/TauT family transport system substrate-binding protein
MLAIRATNVPLTAVLVFDVSAGGDMLLARPSIKNLADLAGKRLGMEKNAVGALVLGKVLELTGLPTSAITLVDLPVDRQLAAWNNNAIDAVISYEPTATMLLRNGAKRLFDSREMPDTIFDVLAVRTDQTAHWRAELKGLVAAHFRGLKHIQQNRQDAIYRIAAYQKISPEEVQQALAGVMLPSLASNREYLAAKNGRLAIAAKHTSNLMVQHGLLKQPDDLVGLSSSDWLPRDDE